MTNELLPKLRFPEFKSDRGWGRENLDSLVQFVEEKIPLNEIEARNYISTENILQDFGGIQISAAMPPSGSATKFTEGDILVSNIRPYLKKIWQADFSGASSNDVIVLRARQRLSKLYLSTAIRSDAFIDYVMRGAKGLKMPRGDIQLIRRYPLPLPSLPEQTRIAACLLSLDTLIAAHGQKLEALREHKRGLMQKLFPAEGKRMPDLRFPEFRGDWETNPLSFLAEVVRGGSPRPIENFMTSDPAGLNWLKIGDVDSSTKYITRTAEKVKPEALNKTRVVKAGELILSNSMSFGRPYIAKIDVCIHDGWLAITRIKPKIVLSYLYYYLLSQKSQSFFKANAAGAVVQNLNKDIVNCLEIDLPSICEQKKIVVCLDSLDSYIVYQQELISNLKLFKQGLMQDLFPLGDQHDQ